MAGGFFERLKAGLSRTAEAVANLLARPMDDQAAEELRERLILGDFGPATADEARLLAVAPGSACLVVTRRTFTRDATITLARLVHPGQHYSLHGEFQP